MSKASPTPKFYTIKRVAERYDVCERTVQRWIKSGRLKAHKFGKSIRVSDENLRLLEATACESNEDLQS